MHQALRLTTTTKDGRLERWLLAAKINDGNGPHDAADDSVKHSPGRRKQRQGGSRKPDARLGPRQA